MTVGKAVAGEKNTASDKPPVAEIFSGGILTKTSSISWVGGVYSLTGNLYSEGWRVRVLGAYGRYVYNMGDGPNTAEPSLFELTPGYQWRKGRLISKLFVGLHGEQHRLALADASNRAARRSYGLKLLSENWIDLPWNSFVSLDASYSTRKNAYQAGFRTGSAKLVSRIRLGPEAHILGNGEHYQLRGGGFVRYGMSKGSLGLSAGMAFDYEEKATPYMGLSYLHKF